MKRLSEQVPLYLTFFAASSLPRASAVKMPSAAKAAQTSRAAWKLVTKVCCRAVTLVRGRCCACGEERRVPAVAPPKAAKTVPPIGAEGWKKYGLRFQIERRRLLAALAF